MTGPANPLEVAWWAKNIDDVDREIARLCLLRRARILDPGVIERVVENLVTGRQHEFASARELIESIAKDLAVVNPETTETRT